MDLTAEKVAAAFEPLGMDPKHLEGVTCHAMNQLYWGGHRLKRILELAQKDLALVKAGIEIVYALDFSELYTFIWPERSRSYSRQITKSILRAPNIKLTLLPGTVYEFARHLKAIASRSEIARRRISEATARSFAAAFFEQMWQGQLLGDALELARSSKEVLGVFDEFSKWGGIYGRLRMFSETSNLTPLGDLLDDTDKNLYPDLDVFLDCKSRLDDLRYEGREHNNAVDAFNCALTWSLTRKHVTAKHRIYVLVTSSSAPYWTFRAHKWGMSPADEELCPELCDRSLVRHPIHILYLSALSAHGGRARRELDWTIRGLNGILEAWKEIPEFKRYKSALARDNLAKSHQLAHQECTMPRSRKYLDRFFSFRCRYERLFGTVRSAIESDLVLEKNLGATHPVNPFVGQPRIGDMPQEVVANSNRQVFELFDRINILALRTLEKIVRSNRLLPEQILRWVDDRGVLGRKAQLVINHVANSQFHCMEIAVRRSTNQELFLAGDLYKDRFVLWWFTRSTLSEFLAGTRRFMKLAEQEVGKISEEGDSAEPNQAMFLYLRNAPEPTQIPLNDWDDLTPEMVNEYSTSDSLVTVRVGSPYGDVYYDFQPHADKPPRSGLISHIIAIQATASLILTTNLIRAGLAEIERILTQINGEFPFKE